MVKIHVGCAGWDYKDWIGPFYPRNLEKSSHLEYYAKYFNLVEINSTFYNLPSKDIIINWSKRVPDSFEFVIKAWQNITHDPYNDNIDAFISQFFYRIYPLEEKVSGILVQFPTWFKYSEKHLKKLLYLLNQFPQEYRYIVELRDNSWYDYEKLGNFIDGKNVVLGTIYLENIEDFYFPNQETFYVRLIGDRYLNVFDHVQRDQGDIINIVLKKVNELTKIPKINEIFIIVNNHFSGFSPETANTIKSLLNIPFKTFSTQKNLLDFI